MIEMAMHTFVPDVRVVGRVDAVVPAETIVAEPLLWCASWEFARERGGLLTQQVLDCLEEEAAALAPIARARGRHLNIDTQSQHLLEGQYPAIPGWHCDAMPVKAPRATDEDEQIARDTVVYTCFVSSEPGGVSQTLFADEPLTLNVDTDHVWPSVHRGAELFLLRRRKAGDGEVVRFDGNTLHRAAECHRTGFRYWFRLTLNEKPPRNVVKHTVQVYTPIEAR